MNFIPLSVALFLTFGGLWYPAANPADERAVEPAAQKSITKEELQGLATKHYKPPINAVVNTAGKKNVVPELNGIEMDLDATWKKIESGSKTERISMVYRQIQPKIKMSDLEPLPIYRGNPVKKQMALMINVAWGTEQIDEMLNILRENQVKATFFLDGTWLSKNQDTAKKIVAEGHEIGNHAYTHPNMSALSAEKQRQQMERTQQEIQNRLGVASKWFAPPSGDFNTTTVQLANQQNMRTVLWTLDTVDWKRPPKEQIVKRILPNAKNGALVLMHPTEPTVGALRILVPSLKQKGFQLVTVSQLLSPVRTVE